jgi:hypothetical protein
VFLLSFVSWHVGQKLVENFYGICWNLHEIVAEANSPSLSMACGIIGIIDLGGNMVRLSCRHLSPEVRTWRWSRMTYSFCPPLQITWKPRSCAWLPPLAQACNLKQSSKPGNGIPRHHAAACRRCLRVLSVPWERSTGSECHNASVHSACSEALLCPCRPDSPLSIGRT